MKTSGVNSVRMAALLLLGLVVLIPQLLQWPYGDEAHLFLKSLWMAEGQIIYRDFFEFITPLSHALYGGMIRLAGPSLIATRLLTLGITLSAVVAIGRMASRYLVGEYRQLLLGLLVVFQCLLYLHLSHHAISAAFAVWAVYFLWRALLPGNTRSSLRSGLYAGGFIGLTLLTTQSLGGLLGLGLGMFCLWLVWRKQQPASLLTGYIGGASFLVAAFLLVLAGLGGLSDAYDCTVQWLAQGQYSKTTVFSYFATGADDILQTLFPERLAWTALQWDKLPMALSIVLLGWLPVLGVLWGLQTLAARYRSTAPQSPAQTDALGLLVLASILMLCATLSYSTTYHVAINGWFAYLLAVMALQAVLRRARLPLKNAVLIACSAMIAMAGLIESWQYYLTMADARYWLRSYGTVEPRFFAPRPPETVLEYATATELLRQLPEHTPVFIYNSSPEVYLFADRPAAPALGKRHSLLYAVYLTTSQRQALLQALNAQRPLLVLFDRKEQSMHRDRRFQRYSEPEVQLSELAAFLNQHYDSISLGEQFELYRLK